MITLQLEILQLEWRIESTNHLQNPFVNAGYSVAFESFPEK